jgi:pyrroline-5-carboxylate reductase
MRTARGAGDVGRSGKCDRCPGFLGPRRVRVVTSVIAMKPRLLVVGGGRMGSALVHGLLGAGWSPTDIVMVEPSDDRRSELAHELPGVEVRPEAVDAQAAVLAVKPAVGEEACRALSSVEVGRVLSIMAGVPLARLETWLPGSTAVVRAMPNTPATVGAGISALSAGSRATEPDLAWAEDLLRAVGHVVRLPEASLDAVTGLSGSGPAYLFLVVEALIGAGMAVGLSEDVSRVLVIDTLSGCARLLVESGESPESLREAVTSPGGTTEAGLRVLEDRGVRVAITAAVAAATERSRQLAR